jgi:hypothetical protein
MITGIITILYFVGDACQSVISVGESYKRLCACKDFPALIQQVSLPTMDKIPFISRLIHSYMGPGMADIDRVRHFLDLKVLKC